MNIFKSEKKMKPERTIIKFKPGNNIRCIYCYNNEVLESINHKIEWHVSKENMQYFGLIELISADSAYPILVKINDLKQ